MKYTSIFIFIVLVAVALSCNNDKKIDSTVTAREDTTATPTPPTVNKDSSLSQTGRKVLTALKNKDYKSLSLFFADDVRVRFSPYGYIDTAAHRSFSKSEFDTLILNNNVVLWGSYDGTGSPIHLTPKQYFEKFVYNADFLNAEKTAIDSILGTGNSLINIDKVYPGARFIEYHFSGFDKKYGGMDWTSLRLIFKEADHSYKLIGIVHDQWTI